MANAKQGAAKAAPKKYWRGDVGAQDDFGDPITDEFVDGKTIYGPWATMTVKTWETNGVGQLGNGFGQKYRKQADGKWLKVAG